MNTTVKNISLVLELERAVKYLKVGLSEVLKISGANDFYDPMLSSLANGLERLFKVMICLHFEEENGRLPQPNEAWNKRKGHDLIYLKRKIEEMCTPINRPFAARDYAIITQDETVNEICHILGEFGMKARYFRLDAVLGVDQPFDAKAAWERLETRMNQEHYGIDQYYELLQQPKELDSLYTNSSQQIVKHLDVLIRALARQFTFGHISRQSKSLGTILSDFEYIEDHQLGTRDYTNYLPHERIR